MGKQFSELQAKWVLRYRNETWTFITPAIAYIIRNIDIRSVRLAMFGR